MAIQLIVNAAELDRHFFVTFRHSSRSLVAMSSSVHRVSSRTTRRSSLVSRLVTHRDELVVRRDEAWPTQAIKLHSIPFLADRTNGRAIATLLRLSVVCDVMYCG